MGSYLHTSRIRVLGLGITALVVASLYLLAEPASDTADSEMSFVAAGCSNALDSIHSGRGTVTVEEHWDAYAGKPAGSRRIEGKVAFSGDQWRVDAATTTDGGNLAVPVTAHDVYTADGAQHTVYYADRERGLQVLGGPQSEGITAWRSTYETSIRFPGNGLENLGQPLRSGGIVGPAPKVVGTEVVKGEECWIVEQTLSITQPGQATSRVIRHSWVNPVKGFTIPLSRMWVEGPSVAGRVLAEERAMEARDYGAGVWGPAVSSFTKYARAADGSTTKILHRITRYGADFELNIALPNGELTYAPPSGTEVYDALLDRRTTIP